MRTSNPVLKASTFDLRAESGTATMTIMGTVHKTAFLVSLVLFAAVFTWNECIAAGGVPAHLYPWLIGSVIGGLVLSLVTAFKPHIACYTAVPYALLEGVFLGALSALFETMYPGIAMQATGMTATTLLALLFAYRSGLIRATENFKLGMAAATGAIALIYLASWILSFFGIRMPLLHENGIAGIGISMFIVIVAALNLVLDFDFIEQGEKKGAPKHMEWYASFGLLVTLVWLYVETLRLLAKLNSRD
ncbi:MAG: Bax inhibitor-1/YccA family protein [Planctomycetota bacterium]